MRITAKGQVTIPAEIRQRTGLLPHTDVEFRSEGGAVRIVRAKTRRGSSRGQKAIAGLRGSATVKMTTNEILRLTRKP